jgi:hypothetical protein
VESHVDFSGAVSPGARPLPSRLLDVNGRNQADNPVRKGGRLRVEAAPAIAEKDVGGAFRINAVIYAFIALLSWAGNAHSIVRKRRMEAYVLPCLTM